LHRGLAALAIVARPFKELVPMASSIVGAGGPARAACTRLLVVAGVLVALVQLGSFAWALVWRARFAMDLEWLEGAQLYEAYRFAHGLSVYGPPALGFVPSPYPPLYHLVVAGVGHVFGFDYWNGRVVSDASLLAALAVQTVVVVRAAPSRGLGWTLAIMGAAGVAATYRPLQASMDLARVDMMAYALVAVAACLALRAPLGWGRAALVGALLCAAVFTKQTNVSYAVWIVAHTARRDARGAAIAGGAALALSAGALALLQQSTGGWFWTWMTIMRHHPLVPERCAVAGVAIVAMAALLSLAMRGLAARGWLRAASWHWCGMLAASLPAGVMPVLTPGGWLNNLIGPAMLLWIVSLQLVCDGLRGAQRDPVLAGRATRWVLGAFAAFLLGALYDPSANVPDAERTRDVARLHAMVRGLPGDVLVPMYPFVAVRDGKATPQLSLVADFDAMGSGRMAMDLPGAMRARHARWVVLCGHAQEHDVPAWLGQGYVEHDLDLRVQALREETRRSMTLWERAGGG
jgi:hypothetical protein